MVFNQVMFSSAKLNNMLDEVAINIRLKINEVKRELTEDEKNDIISKCCKENFNI